MTANTSGPSEQPDRAPAALEALLGRRQPPPRPARPACCRCRRARLPVLAGAPASVSRHRLPRSPWVARLPRGPGIYAWAGCGHSQSTGPAVSTWLPSGRPSTALGLAAAQASSFSRSIPVSYPISCSIETRSSLAMLPVAPLGTGQPPSSPNEDSKRAHARLERRQRRWRAPARGCCGSGPVSSASSSARSKKRAHLGGVGHAGGVAEARSPRSRPPPAGAAISSTRSRGHLALVGAAERHRDHALAAQPLLAGARRAPARGRSSDSSIERFTFAAVVGLGGREEEVDLAEAVAQLERVVEPALVRDQHRHGHVVGDRPPGAGPRRRRRAEGSRRRARSS